MNIILIILLIIASIFWAYMIFRCATHKFNKKQKREWLLLVIFTHFVGGIEFYINVLKKKSNVSVFIETLRKLSRRYFYVMLCDIAIVAVSYIAIKIWGIGVERLSQRLSVLELPLMQTSTEVGAVASSLKLFLAGLIVYSIILFIVLVLVWSFFNWIAWRIIYKLKLFKTAKYYLKFFLLNLIWCIVWLVIFILVFLATFNKQELITTSAQIIAPLVLVLILGLIMTYFTMLIYIAFTKKEKIFGSFALAFKSGVINVKSLIVPYLFIIYIGIILNFIIQWPSRLLLGPNFSVFTAFNIITLIVFLAYASWFRFYKAECVEHYKII